MWTESSLEVDRRSGRDDCLQTRMMMNWVNVVPVDPGCHCMTRGHYQYSVARVDRGVHQLSIVQSCGQYINTGVKQLVLLIHSLIDFLDVWVRWLDVWMD